jgi:hypothetical protein
VPVNALSALPACLPALPAGSTKVQVQEVGGEASWWQDLLGGTLGTWLQGWIG